MELDRDLDPDEAVTTRKVAVGTIPRETTAVAQEEAATSSAYRTAAPPWVVEWKAVAMIPRNDGENGGRDEPTEIQNDLSPEPGRCEKRLFVTIPWIMRSLVAASMSKQRRIIKEYSGPRVMVREGSTVK